MFMILAPRATPHGPPKFSSLHKEHKEQEEHGNMLRITRITRITRTTRRTRTTKKTTCDDSGRAETDEIENKGAYQCLKFEPTEEPPSALK